MKRPGTQVVKEMTISTDFCKVPLLIAQQVFLPLKNRVLMVPLIYILNLIYMIVLLCTSLCPQVLILLNISQPVVSRSPQGMSNDNTACTCYFASILISSMDGKRYHWQVQEGDSKVHGLNISVFPLRRWNHSTGVS